jgi:aspartate dehydrogenase
MTSAAQIGIIGYGAIGRDLCDRLGREGHRVVLLLRAGSTSRESAPPGVPVVDTVEALIALRPQLVVEAAGQAVLDQMAESILRAGVSLIAASTGALGDPRLFSRLEAAAREAETRLIVPAGALGGLDYLAAPATPRSATPRASRRPLGRRSSRSPGMTRRASRARSSCSKAHPLRRPSSVRATSTPASPWRWPPRPHPSPHA